MSDLPPGWVETSIENVFAVLADGRTLHQGWSPQCEKEPSRSEDDWGVLKTTAIQDGVFLPEHNKRLPDHFDPRPLIEVREGDILITCAGPRARCGISCLVTKTRPRLMISGKMYRFRAPERYINPHYIAFYLQSAAARSAIDRMKTGISDSGLNLTHDRFRRLQIPIAPSEEQDRIVAAIEEQFSRLDAGTAALERVRQNLKRMRASVLQAAVTGRLVPQSGDPAAAAWLVKQLHHDAAANGRRKTVVPAVQYLDPIPDTWQVVALADMAQSIDYGTSEKTHAEAKGIPVLRMGNLGWGTIAYNDLKFLPRERLDSRLLLQHGDLLFNRTNSAELVGKTAIFHGYPKDIAFASYLIRVQPLPSANLEWANIVLNSAIGRRYIASVRIQQVGQANVNGTKLAATPIPLPSAEEQSRIITECERLFSMIDMLEDAAVAAIDRGEYLRSSVLATAFAGNLVAQDPSDKPASVLLELIASQQAKFNGNRSQRIRGRRTPRGKVMS